MPPSPLTAECAVTGRGAAEEIRHCDCCRAAAGPKCCTTIYNFRLPQPGSSTVYSLYSAQHSGASAWGLQLKQTHNEELYKECTKSERCSMNYECPQSVTKVKTSGSVWPTAGDSEGWRHYPELREVRPTSASYTPPHPGPRSCRVWPHTRCEVLRPCHRPDRM